MTHSSSRGYAFALLTLWAFASVVVTEASVKYRKTLKDDSSLRGSINVGTQSVNSENKSGMADSDEDDDDDDDDDADPSEDFQERDGLRKAVRAAKQKLAANKYRQLDLKNRIEYLSHDVQSNREIDENAMAVGNETGSPATGLMLANMWRDIRMFATPSYKEYVKEEIRRLKREERGLDMKLADAEKKLVSASTGQKMKQQQRDYGDSDCACVGIDELEGETLASLKDGSLVPYPADLGGRCEAWDAFNHPKCPGESWCEQKWCYVDPCKCKSVSPLPKPSTYLPDAKYQGRPVHFSYATCGGKDSYSVEEDQRTALDIKETCAVKVDSAKWGNEKCRCIGIGPQKGTTKVAIKGKLVDFPADTGATCNAWEKDNHPECHSSDPPSWCKQAWCYVDPCSCKLPDEPKTSSYLPSSKYQGKPIYYSYATCGADDSYTAGRTNACVNKRSSVACRMTSKCAWTGTKCLGKELVNVCGLNDRDRSRALSSKMSTLLVMLLVRVFL